MEGRGGTSNSRELVAAIMDKVGSVITSANDAKHVGQVICALHSLAVLLFPIDSRSFAGSIDEQYRDMVLNAEVPTSQERENWWQVFYSGAAFPTLARTLLYDLALNWLACFPISAKNQVYDVFFLKGQITEVIQMLVAALQHKEDGQLVTGVCSNAERLLAVCLIDKDGIHQLAMEFARPHQSATVRYQHSSSISGVAQLLTSIPDKARLGASTSLSSHLFFKHLAIQLVHGAEEQDMQLCNETAISSINSVDGTLLFVGEAFARVCRRGSADVLLSEVIPRILMHIQRFLLPGTHTTVGKAFESHPGLRFWSKLMEAIKDTYAIERISEQLLHYLATQSINDTEAYWILWILFHQIYEHQTSIRSLFVEKFLLWKVFPISCLRWILQFAVLGGPPDSASEVKGQSRHGKLATMERLLAVWSKREFVQSVPIEQQAYITAAVGLSLEKMSKDDLDAAKGAMQSILEGVSCRLESPSHLVRKMASSVALVFSNIIDPNNPLYLDEGSSKEETIDWEFGFTTLSRTTLAKSHGAEKNIEACITEKGVTRAAIDQTNSKVGKKKVLELKLVDPDEVIDPATLNGDSAFDDDENDDGDSDNSETSSDSSLQPYDLSDDDTDLKKKFSQLVDVVGALRKSEDADGVERALDVAEKLICAAPDELKFVASDLIRTLVQVRCSDSTLEGEEESAEEKRQKALIALIITCPFESLDPIHKLLYSPNLDISQRIMILDVMTEAAKGLANSKTSAEEKYLREKVLITSVIQPWFKPSITGTVGAGSWKEISGSESPLNWTYSYERELPHKPGEIKKGKSRRWSIRSPRTRGNQQELLQNEFPQYAAAFMLPAMQGFDKKRHGVDLLSRDFIVLGKLVYMLGVCMNCASLHPEASALSLPLMDMLRLREICNHPEAYVRRSVLFAASCILSSLHPSYVASSLVKENLEIVRGLEWIRTWALHVVESDSDKDCYTMAMTCLQLHSEMALQISRALESSEDVFQANSINLPLNLSKRTIKIPYLSGGRS